MAGLRTPILTPPLSIKSTAKATQALKATGSSAKAIKKVSKATPSLSKGMQQWVKANRSKLKDPTDKQKAIFEQYDKLKKEGRLSNDAGLPSKNKASQSTPKSTQAPKSNFKSKVETKKPDKSFKRAKSKKTTKNPSSPASDKAVKGGYTFSTISKPAYRKLLTDAKTEAEAQRIRQRYRNRVR